MHKRTIRNERGQSEALGIIGGGIAILVAIALLVVIFFAILAFSRSFGRNQARKDANNRVKISSIEIRNQTQRIQIEKQKAEIRLQKAIGVREAQDEIAKTLTPLYVQFEMVDALRQIAQSGKNNSVVYIPAGANGIPLVSNVSQGQVGLPDKQK